MSEIVCINTVGILLAPGGVPGEFMAEVGERRVNFSWSPPVVTLRNGNITGYSLFCSPSPASLPLTLNQPGTHTVERFSPDTRYMCSVIAHNSQGSGPPASTDLMTLEDCR